MALALNNLQRLVCHWTKKLKPENFPFWNEFLGNRTWPRSQILFSQNKFVTSAQGSAYQQLNLLVMWDLPTANNCRLILHWSFLSSQQVNRESVAGLRSHRRVHRIYVNAKDMHFACHICSRIWKFEVGRRSHMRFHRCLFVGKRGFFFSVNK